MVSKDASSIKRLAYVMRRVRLLQELERSGVVKLYNVPGTANPSDALTKHLKQRSSFVTYMCYMYNCEIARMCVDGRPCLRSSVGGML